MMLQTLMDVCGTSGGAGDGNHTRTETLCLSKVFSLPTKSNGQDCGLNEGESVARPVIPRQKLFIQPLLACYTAPCLSEAVDNFLRLTDRMNALPEAILQDVQSLPEGLCCRPRSSCTWQIAQPWIRHSHA